MPRLLLLLILTMSYLSTHAQDDMSAYSREAFMYDGDTLRYRWLTPAGLDIHKPYPLVIFLHGSGERGTDNSAQLLHGGALFLKDSVRQQFPAYVLFPQCPPNESWGPIRLQRDSTGKVTNATFPVNQEPTKQVKLIKALVDSLLASGKVDPKRIYIGGLSMGGIGTYDMLARYPDLFAAAFPICGAGNVKASSRYAKKVPIWIFHGEADMVVPTRFSREFYDALKKEGADVKYTEYPGVGHNSWDNAFAEPELLPWIFSHTRR